MAELATDFAKTQLAGQVAPAEGLANYDQMLGRAIWWCAAHRLR
jgi:hypothetical protein